MQRGHLCEEFEGEGFRGDVIGVVLEKRPSHEPHRVQFIVLPLYALQSITTGICVWPTSFRELVMQIQKLTVQNVSEHGLGFNPLLAQ